MAQSGLPWASFRPQYISGYGSNKVRVKPGHAEATLLNSRQAAKDAVMSRMRLRA